MVDANWVTCSGCSLKHRPRAEGTCPRCGTATHGGALVAAVEPALYASRCDRCGRAAVTRFVTFNQNIGLIMVRLRKSIRGNLCEPCISDAFISTTVTTLFLGWWGIISAITTPFILIGNVVERVRAKP